MCGIAGMFHPEALKEPRSILPAMADAIVHRGPDAAGFHVDTRAALASRRLRIIDLSGGDQPIYSEDRRAVIVYNGEVYNHRSIRRELEAFGHRFFTGTDTEVVLAAYRQWGGACLHRFTGMFAFCIWDMARRRLFLARDRFGIKPLYYTRLCDGTLLFASELKALLAHPGVERRIDPEALDNLLTFGFHLAPRTFFDGIYQLLPGHFIHADACGAVQKQYWDIDTEAEPLTDSEDRIAEELRRRLEEAVGARLVSDVPVAAYLSGGIDSSAVAGIYARKSGGRVRTISITFDGADYDEAHFARQVARHFGTDHHEFKCRIGADQVSDLVYFLEEPMVTLLNLPLLLLSRSVRDAGLKVVLSGDGADEVLGGYDYLRLLKAMAFIDRHPTEFRKNILRRIFPGLKTPLHAAIQHMHLSGFPSLHPALPYRFQQTPCKRELLAADSPAAGGGPSLPFDPGRVAHRSLVDQALYFETKMRLANLTLPLGDKMSMANSVELRPVFLDHELVDFLFRIPARMKIRGMEEKYILKKCMRGFLPDAICRRKKQPLQPPGIWFLDTVGEAVNDLLSEETVKNKGYFNPGFIRTALREYRKPRNMDYASLLVVAFFVHLWDEVFLSGAVRRSGAPIDATDAAGVCVAQ